MEYHFFPKEVGAFGIINTKHMNWCLMAKWPWKILTSEGGLWLDIIKHKYLQHAPIATDSAHQGSQFWKAIIKICHLLCIATIHTAKNVKSKVFWLDVWIGQCQLATEFPGLFVIAHFPNALVSDT